MEKRDVKSLTNSELRLYRKTLEDKYEVVKTEINKCYELLDEMDVEYNRVEQELQNRTKLKI